MKSALAAYTAQAPSSSLRTAAAGQPESRFFYVFLALVCVLALWPEYAQLKFGGLPNLAPDRVLRAALFIGLVVVLFSNSAPVKVLSRRLAEQWILTTMLLGYFGLRLASAVFSDAPLSAINNFVRVELLTALPMYFYALLALRDERSVRKTVVGLAIAGFFSGVVALIDFKLEKNLFAGLVPVSSDYVMGIFWDKTRDSFYRAQGSFAHPILLGQFFALLLPFLWALLKDPNSSTIRRLFYAASCLIALAAIYVSGSRASQGLALLTILLITFWEIFAWARRSRNRVLQYLVISQLPIPFFAASAALFAFKDSALGTTRATSMSSNARIDMLLGGFPKALEAPLLGHGLGQGLEVFSLIGRGGVRTLDNYYLLTALESGLIAPLLFLLFLVLAAPRLGLLDLSNMLRARLNLACWLAMLSYVVEMSIHSLSQQMGLICVFAALVVVLRESALPARRLSGVVA